VPTDIRRLTTIVSADVAGYSRLMGADESGTLRRLNAHRAELVDPLIDKYGGRIVKTTGDGLLLEFPSVVAAVECCIAAQEGMAERNAGVDSPIRLRIGVHLGDVIVEGDDIFGDGVNIAARLQGIGDVGGVTISGDAYNSVAGRVEGEFVDGGEQELKNIVRAVRVW
jgi:class 3 adenylate cyclase